MFCVPAAIRRLSAVTLAALLAAASPAGSLPAAADEGVLEPGALRCTADSMTPDPNSTQRQVKSVSIAFRCTDASGEPVFRAFDAKFFVEGVARDFQRAGEFGVEILFVEFPGGLSHGTHTARVDVSGDGSFAWSFTVTRGGASHSGGGAEGWPAGAVSQSWSLDPAASACTLHGDVGQLIV